MGPLTPEDIRNILAAEGPKFLMRQRWFGGKARTIQAVLLHALLPVADDAAIAIVDVRYVSGPAEWYALPHAAVRADRLTVAVDDAICTVEVDGQEWLVCDGLALPHVRYALLELIFRQQSVRGDGGELSGFLTSWGQRAVQGLDPSRSYVPILEQSNSAIVCDDRIFVKLFRRLAPGPNPDLEVGRFLTEHAQLECVPRVAGGLEYRPAAAELPWSIAVAQERVDVVEDLWSWMVRSLGEGRLSDCSTMVARVAASTAALHRALATGSDPAFRPEPIDGRYVAQVTARVRTQWFQALDLLEASLHRVDPAVQPAVRHLIGQSDSVQQWLASVEKAGPWGGQRIRIHGDYHLGQVLCGPEQKLYVVDFEGEPARPLAERRRKESPLRDVAGMLRSFDYAGAAAGSAEAHRWARQAEQRFVAAYMEQLSAPELVDPASAAVLLDLFLFEKACYELVYELNNRPDWVSIPLAGLSRITDRLGNMPSTGEA